jgi:hypothetical protein
MSTDGDTEDGHQRGLPDTGNMRDRTDAVLVEFRGRDDADAPEPFDRQRVQERQLSIRRHFE